MNWLKRWRINQDAKRLLGIEQKQDAQERFDFMQTCIDQLTGEGFVEDDDEAQQICALLWEEQGGFD